MAKLTVDDSKLAVLFRYLVTAAMDKRCVVYDDISNVLGISRQSRWRYLRRIAELCALLKLPLLNALVVSGVSCEPSYGFDEFKQGEWGRMVSRCWKHYRNRSPKHFAAANQALKES